MALNAPIAIEILIGFAVPLAWGVWELYDLRRERRKDEAAARRAAPTLPPADATPEPKRP